MLSTPIARQQKTLRSSAAKPDSARSSSSIKTQKCAKGMTAASSAAYTFFMKEKVAILGASKNPERYSYLALKMLQEYGHTVFPVNPGLNEIEGVPVTASLSDLKGIDTVTLYMNPKNLEPHVDKIIKLKPRRVIFNPGTESREIESALQKAGIETLEACTLVMLRTNQFEK